MRNSIEAYIDPMYFAGGPNALHAAAVFYHGSSPLLALDDAMFAKYPLASAIIMFAGTAKAGIEKDARVNPEALLYGELVAKHGASFFVCNNALSGIASWIAQQIAPAGSQTTRDRVIAIHDELVQHFLPGATLVPAGVAALNAAQEARFTFLPT
jgi:intracellular sulfur oxidation DsrE/DsrF family protein